MIAAVAAVLGIAANAASINWGVSNNGATDKGGTTLAKGSTIYLVLASYESSIKTAIDDGKFSASTAGVLSSATTTNTRGRTAEATATSSLLELNLDGTGKSTDFKILVLDTTSVPGETYYKFSGTASSLTYDEAAVPPVPTTVSFGSTQWAGGSSWTQAAPEPTSGLLLLLGVAGLALKRKRA